MSFAEYSTLRRAVFVVALLNLAYFGVEFAVALAIGSVSLFADSVDFLEDASINLLIFVALTWSAPRRALLGMVLAGILLVPGFATLWTAWDKFWLPLPPAPIPLTLAGTAANTPGVALVMDKLALLPWLSNITLTSAARTCGANAAGSPRVRNS